MKVAVSFLKSPNSKEETILKIDQSIADYIHVDLMDGKFAGTNNLDWDGILPTLKKVRKPLDIHLMTLDLTEHINQLSLLNPEWITFHYEATSDPLKMIQFIKEKKCKVGIAINPETEVQKIMPFLSQVDLVLVMTVHPGYGGQTFLAEMISKLKKLREIKPQYHFQISVDGGINDQTLELVKDYADIVVSGSFICEKEDYNVPIKKLK